MECLFSYLEMVWIILALLCFLVGMIVYWEGLRAQKTHLLKKVGSKDKVRGRETGPSKDIILTTDREVIEKLAQFNYQDAKGNAHGYSDCFKVQSIIQLEKLEDRKK